jgi:hypothetical protein
MTTTRIPIWLVETEVGGDLPPERFYSLSFTGVPIGYVVLPEGMTVHRFAVHVRLGPGDQFGPCSLNTRRLVEAAVAEEFGLSWERVEATGTAVYRGGDQ